MDYFGGLNQQILDSVPLTASRILEVGCAKGKLGKAIKERQECEYWGIEAIEAAALEAEQHLDRLIRADIESLDLDELPEDYFDCLVFGDVLEHLRRPEDVLKKLRKYLKLDATMVASVPNIGHWSVIVDLLQGKFDYEPSGLLDRTHLTFFTPDSFTQMLWEAGYHVVSTENTYVQSEACQKLGDLAKSLGLPGEKAFDTSSIYQTVFVTNLLPDPYRDPAVMAKLRGPHVGKLGKPSCRASIVIVTYNSSSTIETCLNSVLATMTTDDEIIVVDNDSHDVTTKLVKHFTKKDSRIKLIESDENLGYSKGMNTGILESRGEYIVMLNPDTEVFPNWLEGFIARLEDKVVGAVGPLSDNVAGRQFVSLHMPTDKKIPLRECPTILTDLHYRQSEYVKLLIGFCLAIRRDTLNEFGQLDENLFFGSDDLELSWRLTSLNYTLQVAKDILVRHDLGISSSTTLSTDIKTLVYRSDFNLANRLKVFFGSNFKYSSSLIWNCEIFPILA